jgi:hypothetical protein
VEALGNPVDGAEDPFDGVLGLASSPGDLSPIGPDFPLLERPKSGWAARMSRPFVPGALQPTPSPILSIYDHLERSYWEAPLIVTIAALSLWPLVLLVLTMLTMLIVTYWRITKWGARVILRRLSINADSPGEYHRFGPSAHRYCRWLSAIVLSPSRLQAPPVCVWP